MMLMRTLLLALLVMSGFSAFGQEPSYRAIADWFQERHLEPLENNPNMFLYLPKSEPKDLTTRYAIISQSGWTGKVSGRYALVRYQFVDEQATKVIGIRVQDMPTPHAMWVENSKYVIASHGNKIGNKPAAVDLYQVTEDGPKQLDKAGESKQLDRSLKYLVCPSTGGACREF